MKPTTVRRLFPAAVALSAAATLIALPAASPSASAMTLGSDATPASSPVGTPETGPTTPAAQDAPTAEQIADAKKGLEVFLSANPLPTPQTSTRIPGCPGLSPADGERLLAGMGMEGWTIAADDVHTEIEWSEYGAVHPELKGIACSLDAISTAGGRTQLGISAADLTGKAKIEDLYKLLPITVEPGKDAGGADRFHWCPKEGPGHLCVAGWHRDGLMIAISVFSETEIDQERIIAAVDDAVVTIAETLGTVPTTPTTVVTGSTTPTTAA